MAGTQLAGTTQYEYDAGQVASIVDKDANGNVLARYQYAYNDAGQITSETDNGVATSYTYDSTGQLLTAGSQTFQYDLNGNPTGSGYVIGQNNQLLRDGTYNYTYDANGNLISQVSIADGTTWAYTPPGDEPPKQRGKTNQPHGRRRPARELRHEPRRYELTTAERLCPECGQTRQEIGVETSRQYDYKPAEIFVIEHQRVKYACKCCQGEVVIAPKPPQPIDRGLPGPGLVPN